MEKKLPAYISYFNYGAKIQIQVKGKMYKTVMSFNSYNNFFLEFVAYKNKLKIVKMIFIPFIRSLRSKFDYNKLKVRMQNNIDSFYIVSDKVEKLELVMARFEELLNFNKKFKYAMYSWRNLMYNALFELNIYKNKDHVFKEKDVKYILSRLKIKNKKKQEPKAKKSFYSQTNEVSLNYFRTSNNFDEQEEAESYYSYVKDKLSQLFSGDKPKIEMEIVEELFGVLIQKNELLRIYEKYNKINIKNKTPWKNTDEGKLIGKMINDTMVDDIDSQNNDKMSFENFITFLKEVQEEVVDAESIDKFNQFFNHIRMTSIFERCDEEITHISFQEFCIYMFSKMNSVFDPDKQDRYQNMNLPLSQYYVSSSHNTYLVGHQLYGKSGMEGYQRAIETGYRCLEIDCWDGSKGEPIVTHGRTLTKNYPFEKIIKLLSEIAFKNNKYPLILSLEMHCNAQQRDKIAYYLVKYFGKKLLVLDDQTISKQYTVKELVNRVLVKTDANYPTKFNMKMEDGCKLKIHDDDTLSHMTCIFKEKIDINSSAIWDFKSSFGVLSLNDVKLLAILKSHTNKNKFIQLTAKSLVRVYPDGKIDSKNFDPLKFWEVGCQMVCLNIQTAEEATLINKVKFMENGAHKCGYLLKPSYLREGASNLVPKEQEYIIEIISGQTLNENLWDEEDFLEIYIRGHSRDELMNPKVYRMQFACNFVHPIILRKFEEPVKFRIMYPDQCFFLFIVKNKNGMKNMGCVPTNCIRTGFRVLSLYDRRLFFNRYSYLLLKTYIKENE